MYLFLFVSRTPVELYRTSLGFAKGSKLSSDIVTEEESANSLTGNTHAHNHEHTHTQVCDLLTLK